MSSGPEELRELVKDRLALDLSRRGDDWFDGMLEEVARAQAIPRVSALLERLRDESTSSVAWGALIDRVTIAETYFFRDSGQMELLGEHLLPRLMREARGRRLRIWSAGCSTGEELYSIAMLLDSLGSPAADLLGTDVNPSVVEQARRGIYRERSLRSLPAGLKAAYLQPHGREFRVTKRLRQRTAFMVENLFAEQSTQLRGLDLIVCRNVLIYFDRDRLPTILERFYKALRPGGLLMTGHGEALTVETAFETLAFPNSLIYRRPEVLGPQRPRRVPTTPPTASRPEFRRAPDKSAPAEGAPTAPDPAGGRSGPGGLDSVALCRQAREARQQGRAGTAQKLLWQSLYLDPESPEAYLELGLLLAGHKPEKARRCYATALSLLAGTVPDPATTETLRELERVLA